MDKQELGQENGQESAVYRGKAIDLDFLAVQTHADQLLERDVLELFLAQSDRILSTISSLDASQQAEKAHLMKGSARGIGAWAVAEAASRYESAQGDARRDLFPVLVEAVAAAERAIKGRLATLGV